VTNYETALHALDKLAHEIDASPEQRHIAWGLRTILEAAHGGARARDSQAGAGEANTPAPAAASARLTCETCGGSGHCYLCACGWTATYMDYGDTCDNCGALDGVKPRAVCPDCAKPAPAAEPQTILESALTLGHGCAPAPTAGAETVSERCRREHYQQCGFCEDLDCGDNYNPPSITILARRDERRAALARVRERVGKLHVPAPGDEDVGDYWRGSNTAVCRVLAILDEMEAER
jgi:hypothetical protein